MYSFILGFLILLTGYLVYSKFIEREFAPDENAIPPSRKYKDNFDYVEMSTSKNAFIQLLNIAGTGPIFGPIMGALFGPIAFLLIPIGNIIGGAVHDYSIGMISMRNKGSNLPSLSGKYIGSPTSHLVNILTVLLLLLVGTVFITTPAKLLNTSLKGSFNLEAGQDIIYWISIVIIFGYYLIATLLPVDKVIGRLYPYLGGILTISAFAIALVLMYSYHSSIPEISFKNFHPSELPIFPMFFMTVTCGLCSGFHATQSPIVARTLNSELNGRKVFYGMMVLEGVIAMIWAAAAMSLFKVSTNDVVAGLNQVLKEGGPAYVVKQVSMQELGLYGGLFAVIGVIILPITSGDTAFRSLRLIIAEYMNLQQTKVINRYLISIPTFFLSFCLLFIPFGMLWRYFSWANQTLATVALFTGAGYLYKHRKNYLVCLLPGSFMLYMSLCYLLNNKIGFNLPWNYSYIIGAFLTSFFVWLFYHYKLKERLLLDSA